MTETRGGTTHSVAAVAKLLDSRPELTLDGQRPNREQLAARLAGFGSRTR